MARSGIRRWTAMWPLAVLCVLASSRWLLEGVQPNTVSTMFSEAAGCMSVAMGLAVFGLRQQGRRVSMTGSFRRFRARAIAGIVGVLAGPTLAETVSTRHISASNGTLALALTPVVVGVAVSAVGERSSGDLAARLWPGLAGIAGLLLLLPQPALSDWRLSLALCLLPLMVGVGSVASWQETDATAKAGSKFDVVVGLAATACVFGLLGLWDVHVRGSEPWSVWASVLDGSMAALTLLSLNRLGPGCWSVQFLLVPLLTLLQGLVFLHPLVDGRSWLGLGLLAGSSGYQIWAGDEVAPAALAVRTSAGDL